MMDNQDHDRVCTHWANEFLSRRTAERNVNLHSGCARSSLEELDDGRFFRMLGDGMPVILTGALALFGGEVGSWRNSSRLREVAGDAQLTASYFSSADGTERFGNQISADGAELLVPPERVSSLREHAVT